MILSTDMQRVNKSTENIQKNGNNQLFRNLGTLEMVQTEDSSWKKCIQFEILLFHAKTSSRREIV